ncbi:cyclin N-terminal domain-containing protein [Favolaschia claudopus]|uniref:Cyclin N-terminal domain-containing protein n=1 Tax=Favolaschia claudopus TaxID=2862362 RepID=A0AAW0CL22_9AGAR
MVSPASSSSSGSYSSWSPASSSGSSRTSPVHPASLVPPTTHSPELLKLIDIQLSQPVYEYVSASVLETVTHAFGRPSPTLSAHTHKFTQFVQTVLSRAEVPTPTLLVALVYVARARTHLSIALEQWALERVFLGALIVASKYTQDSTLRNVHWAMVTGVFGRRDIGRIEREFLEVLDWELAVRESDIVELWEALAGAVPVKDDEVVEEIPWVDEKDLDLDVVEVVVESVPLSPETAVIPDLDPSSPHSSSGTLSPRTPISHHEMDVDVVASPTWTIVHSPSHSHSHSSPTHRLIVANPDPPLSSSSAPTSIPPSIPKPIPAPPLLRAPSIPPATLRVPASKSTLSASAGKEEKHKHHHHHWHLRETLCNVLHHAFHHHPSACRSHTVPKMEVPRRVQVAV